jgi:hypothetical protein
MAHGGRRMMTMKIPLFGRLLQKPTKRASEATHRKYMEQRLHLFAMMMALYPFTPTAMLAEEFKLSRRTIKMIANEHGVHKNKDMRIRICKENGDNPRSRKAAKLYYAQH